MKSMRKSACALRPATPTKATERPARGVLGIGKVHEALRNAQVVGDLRANRDHNERLQSHNPHGQRKSQTSTAVYKTAV